MIKLDTILISPLIALFFWSFGSFVWLLVVNHETACESQTTSCFLVRGMNSCHPLLACNDLLDIEITGFLGNGIIKDVYLAKWKIHYIAVLKLKDISYLEDFRHNLNMLMNLGPSKHINQLVGHCNQSIVFTEYQPYGSLNNLPFIGNLKTKSAPQCLRMCIQYVETMSYLHDSSLGTRVMCDSNDLEKLLSQFLISEDNEYVIANDLDALPATIVDGKEIGVKCGHKELFGDFVAPEQLWSLEGPFNDTYMPPYNEKIDVFKVPDVCNWILDQCYNVDYIRESIEPLHRQCKSKNPKDRPTMLKLLKFYRNLYKKIQI